MGNLADRIIRLVLYTRKASMTASGTFGLQERLLFCLKDAPQPPRELLDTLCMTKSNLALLAKKCIAEELIVKTKPADDRRTLYYALTEKGRDALKRLTDEIERKFDKVLTTSSERQTCQGDMDSVIELLSYL